VNLRWSHASQRFEAEFADFNGDLSAVKAAGFKTDGPETGWIWHSHKIAVINKLRENKPPSGLTITPEAFLIYEPMAALEEQNQIVRKKLADFKKSQKKKVVQLERETVGVDIFRGLTEEHWWIGAEDLPVYINREKPFIPPAAPELRCSVCSDPVYWYEYPEIPMCLWCSKSV
jgi:hypothetical protein